MKCYAYLKQASKYRAIVESIAAIAGFDEVECVDLDTQDLLDNLPGDCYALAFGQTTVRRVKEYSKKLLPLPAPSKLLKRKQNAATRKQVLEQLRDFKANLSAPKEPSVPSCLEDIGDKDWSYAIVKRGQQRICVYEGTRPDVEADAFISKADMHKLVKLVDVLQADLVILDKPEDPGE